jgi:hypothetical protein
MMSLLTYITEFFMNFELLPILTDYANFDDWVRRHKKCVDLKGDYVEKS